MATKAKTALPKRKANDLVEKSYRLTDSRSGEAFLLKVGRNKNLLYFDEALGTNRAIRHCPNEKSIFIDEQSQHALVEPIIFLKGLLVVPREHQATQKFLEAHPDNVKNGGAWFEEINDEQEAGEEIEREELITEIKQIVKSKGDEADGIYELEMIVATLTNSIADAAKMSKSELKRTIYQFVDTNPYYFTDDAGNINIFDDEQTQRKYLTLRALKEGIIKKSPNQKAILWSHNNSVIVNAPQGLDLVEYFSDYLSTDAGILVIEEIKKLS